MSVDPRVINFLRILAREYQEEARKEQIKSRKKKKNDRKRSSGIA